MWPALCASEETVTTRPVTLGSSMAGAKDW